jgi:hypothetical protein
LKQFAQPVNDSMPLLLKPLNHHPLNRIWLRQTKNCHSQQRRHENSHRPHRQNHEQ